MSSPTRKELLNKLPPFKDEWITINANQDVKDIIKEILYAHKQFANYYDELALYFDGSTTQQICDNIYNFLKRNVSYIEESDSDQTTAVPAGILTRGYGDCKHYASLAGGILDGLNRYGRNIDWCYRFASYNIGNRIPHHVFVVVNDGNDEIWIDPTPGSEDKYPVWQLDKKVKKSNMALRRNIGGMNGLYQPDDFGLVEGPAGEMAVESREPYSYIPGSATDTGIVPDVYNPDTDDSKLPPELINNLQLLLDYGILDNNGNFNSAALYNLQGQVDADMYKQLLDATYYLEDSSEKISGFFSDLWRGVKKVTLAAPRGAFLGLVALNVFGYATKLAQAMSTGDGFQKVRDIWYSVGGDLAKLEGSINAGKKRKRILGAEISMGIVAAAAIPAWITIAGAIITILMPVIKMILENQRKNQVPYVEGFDPSDVDFKPIPPQIKNNDPMQWIQDHPMESAALGLGLYLVLTKKKIF